MDDPSHAREAARSLHGAAPDPGAPSGPGAPGPTRSRRGFLLAGGFAVAAAAGGGVALGLADGTTNTGRLVARVPAELDAAAEAERELIAIADRAMRAARGRRRAELRQIRANHSAHLAAVEAVIAEAVYPAAVPSASPSTPSTASNVSRSVVRSAEKRAAAAATARASRLTGRNAVLLASIAASEASHAELLS